MKKLIYLLLLYGMLRCTGGKEFLPMPDAADPSPKWKTDILEESAYSFVPVNSVSLTHHTRDTEDKTPDLEHTHDMPNWPNPSGGKNNTTIDQGRFATPTILPHKDGLSLIIIPVFIG